MTTSELPGGWKEAARRIEAEAQRVLGLVEERVVPQARRDTEKALRSMAAQLSRWADHLHDEPGVSPRREAGGSQQ